MYRLMLYRCTSCFNNFLQFNLIFTIILLLLLSLFNHHPILIKCQSIKVQENELGISNSKQNVEVPDFILFGPGLTNANLIFPSRYFFVFHKTLTIDLDSIVIRYRDPVIKQEQSIVQNCRLWTQTLNQSHFCLAFDSGKLANFLDSKQEKKQDDDYFVSENLTLDELFEFAEDYCDDDDDGADLVTKNGLSIFRYRLSIVRYRLYLQDRCDIPLQVIVEYNRKEDEEREQSNRNQTLQFQVNIEMAPNEDSDQSAGDNQPDDSTVLYSDQCNCPRSDWAKQMRCQTSPANKAFLHEQIEPSLKPFKDGIDFDSVLSEAIDRFASHPRTYSFCLYQIISNQLYHKCYGEYVGFARFFDEMFQSLLRKTPLADTEFLVNLGDWPLSSMTGSPGSKASPPNPLPIFSWCGSSDSYDLVLPTYELTESILHAQTRISNDIFSIFGHQLSGFDEKENRLFWRGRDSNRARLKLIKLSFKEPELFNVSITNFFFFRDEMAEYTTTTTTVAPSVDDNSNTFQYNSAHIPFRNFFDYRYQINLDGTVAAYRFLFLLAGNSLTIKQRSDYYEFYYNLLQSGQHYIEVDENLEELIGLLEQLLSSKDHYNSKQIIWNARRFVLLYLLPENIYCYYHNALESYTKLLLPTTTDGGQIKLRDGVEIVTIEEQQSIDDSKEDCQCLASKRKQSKTKDSQSKLESHHLKDEL